MTNNDKTLIEIFEEVDSLTKPQILKAFRMSFKETEIKKAFKDRVLLLPEVVREDILGIVKLSKTLD
jgi:hypothetical protein